MDLEPVILVAIWKGKDADQERDMCEIYGGLVMSVNAEWTWNQSY